MEVKDDKKSVRQQIKVLKSAYSPEALQAMSCKVWEQVEGLEAFKMARCVMAYWSLPDEVDTHDCVVRWSRQKQIVLPKVNGSLLELRYFQGEMSLRRGNHFGILEPTGSLITDYNSIDFVVVPGVAFTPLGERLGRGGGYYDRLLPELGRAFKAGVAFPFQIREHLPVADYDVKMDKVLFTEMQKPA